MVPDDKHGHTSREPPGPCEPQGAIQPTRPRRCRRWPVVVFPVVLWAFATCYFGGRLGKWMDDYVNSVRDPVTGEWSWADIFERTASFGAFYRPATHFLVVAKATLFDDHFWVNSLLNCATHGLAAWLLWHLLRRLTQNRRSAWVGAIFFLVYPVGHEAVLCSSGQPTSIATGTFLLLALTYWRYARGAWGWKSVLLMVGLAYSIPNWQEPPAVTVVALPLLYFAARKTDGEWRTHLWRSLAPVVACCLALGIYVMLWQTTDFRTKEAKGGPGTWVSHDQLIARAATLARSAETQFHMESIATGGFEQGQRVLRSVRGAIWIVLLLVSLVPWLHQWFRSPFHDPHPAAGTPFRTLVLGALFSIVAFLLAWLPILLSLQAGAESRLCYHPGLFLAILLAIAVDAVAGAARGWSVSRALFVMVSGVGLTCAALYLSVCFVGVQSLYREQYQLDQTIMAQLRERLPSPQGGTVFVPLSIDATSVHTGVAGFDRGIYGGLEFCWVAPKVVRRAYKRTDLLMTSRCWNGAIPIEAPTSEGFTYTEPDPLFRAEMQITPKGGVRIPWCRVVPFTVDANRHVHLVSTIHVARGPKDGFDVTFEQVADAQRRSKLPEVTFVLEDPDAWADMSELSGWRWVETDQAATFNRISNWGRRTVPCVWLHAPYPGHTERRAIATELAPSPGNSRIYFQVGFSQWDLENRPWGDGVDLAWYFQAQKDRPLRSMHITPEQIASRKQWMDVCVDIPALRRPRTLVVEIGPGPKGDYDYDACWITIGYSEDLGKVEPRTSQPATQTTCPGN